MHTPSKPRATRPSAPVAAGRNPLTGEYEPTTPPPGNSMGRLPKTCVQHVCALQ